MFWTIFLQNITTLGATRNNVFENSALVERKMRDVKYICHGLAVLLQKKGDQGI